MTRWWLWTAIVLFLATAVTAAVLLPHEMVSPGNLRAAHMALESDCFACHIPFRGASAERCIACHKVADIGKRTTRGAPIRRDPALPPFHQALKEKDCLACHSDHPAPSLTHRPTRSFDHDLLTDAMRGQCGSCHVAPKDEQHRGTDLPCAECHQPARWKPSTFDHGRYFALDGDHRVACATCHVGLNYRQYTCYGCHEHAPARIRAKHEEEGIRNFANCVRCHRSAHGEAREGGESEGRAREDD